MYILATPCIMERGELGVPMIVHLPLFPNCSYGANTKAMLCCAQGSTSVGLWWSLALLSSQLPLLLLFSLPLSPTHLHFVLGSLEFPPHPVDSVPRMDPRTVHQESTQQGSELNPTSPLSGVSTVTLSSSWFATVYHHAHFLLKCSRAHRPYHLTILKRGSSGLKCGPF